MKLMKGIKKLKFWSKNKTNNNDYQKLLLHHHHYNFQTPSYHSPPPPLRPPPPQPSQEAFHCHFYQPVEPSAPPLPPWLEMQLKPEPEPEPEPELEPVPEPDGEDCRNISQEICVYNPAVCSIKKDGVYSGKGPGVLGCVVEVGGFVFRCLFPCFHFSEIHSKHTAFHNLDFNHNKIL